MAPRPINDRTAKLQTLVPCLRTAPKLSLYAGFLLWCVWNPNISSGLDDDVIALAIGPGGATTNLQVYRGLLCHHSMYFDRMLNGGFSEAGEKVVRLPNVNVQAFRSFFHWINARIVDLAPDDESTHEDAWSAWEQVTEAYIFADFHQANAFRNAVLDYVFLRIEKTGTFATYIPRRLYPNTHQGDRFRKFLVNLTAEITWSKVFEKAQLQDYNK